MWSGSRRPPRIPLAADQSRASPACRRPSSVRHRHRPTASLRSQHSRREQRAKRKEKRARRSVEEARRGSTSVTFAPQLIKAPARCRASCRTLQRLEPTARSAAVEPVRRRTAGSMLRFRTARAIRRLDSLHSAQPARARAAHRLEARSPEEVSSRLAVADVAAKARWVVWLGEATTMSP